MACSRGRSLPRLLRAAGCPAHGLPRWSQRGGGTPQGTGVGNLLASRQERSPSRSVAPPSTELTLTARPREQELGPSTLSLAWRMLCWGQLPRPERAQASGHRRATTPGNPDASVRGRREPGAELGALPGPGPAPWGRSLTAPWALRCLALAPLAGRRGRAAPLGSPVPVLLPGRPGAAGAPVLLLPGCPGAAGGSLLHPAGQSRGVRGRVCHAEPVRVPAVGGGGSAAASPARPGPGASSPAPQPLPRGSAPPPPRAPVALPSPSPGALTRAGRWEGLAKRLGSAGLPGWQGKTRLCSAAPPRAPHTPALSRRRPPAHCRAATAPVPASAAGVTKRVTMAPPGGASEVTSAAGSCSRSSTGATRGSRA